MILDVGVASLIITISLGLGAGLVIRLSPPGALTLAELGVTSFLIGFLFLGGAVWIVGSLVFTPVSMIALSGGIFVIALPGLWAFLLMFKKAFHVHNNDLGYFDYLLMVVVGGLAVTMLVSAMAPPADSDAVRYHLLLPKRDMELGRVAAIYGWSIFDFFPSIVEMIYRLGLILSGPNVAHLIHVFFALSAAVIVGALALRVNATVREALLAAGLFLSIRVVIYQSPTADIDQAVTAGFATLLVLFLAWRNSPAAPLAVLIGLVAAFLLYTKYNTIPLLAVIGIVIIFDHFYRSNIKFPRHFFIMGGVAFICILPFLMRNFVVTGNPIFPLYHHLFASDHLDIFASVLDFYRRDADLVQLIMSPIRIFLYPRSFDGFQFGSVLLLVAMPFVFMARERLTAFGLLVSIVAVFFVAWIGVMTQQVRFMQPIFPIFAVFAAVGLLTFWQYARQNIFTKYSFVLLIGLLVLNQSMFFAGTAVRRVPVALGLTSDEAFLTSPPYIKNTHLKACRFLEQRLKTGETYINLLQNPSFYCPQGSVMNQVLPGDEDHLYSKQHPTTLAKDELKRVLFDQNVKWVLADIKQDRSPLLLYQKLDFTRDRLGPDFRRALENSEPTLVTSTARIFEIADVLATLDREDK